MNEFNVLLNAATNGTPSGSLFDALFARYIAPQESWRELKSPLPITILAAGEDLIDYRIFGNTENGESVGERTENLLDKDVTKFENNKKLLANGNLDVNTYHCVSDYIPILPGTVYSVFNPNNGNNVFHCFYNSNKDFLMSFPAYGQGLQTATSPANAAYIRCTLLSYVRYPEALKVAMLIEGSTAPTSYIPYGYKLPMVVTNGTTTTTTPIYIGSDPLAEDEYVDFGGQKVYRRTKNLLSPAIAETKIVNGITATSDGNGNYHLYGTASSNAKIEFSVDPFYMPSIEDGLVVALFNNQALNYKCSIFLGGAIYLSPTNRVIINPPTLGGRYVSGVIFTIASETVCDFTISPVVVSGLETPQKFIPYLLPTDPPAPIPALPTIEGETIIDYNPSETPAVEPEKMYVKYKPQ